MDGITALSAAAAELCVCVFFFSSIFSGHYHVGQDTSCLRYNPIKCLLLAGKKIPRRPLVCEFYISDTGVDGNDVVTCSERLGLIVLHPLYMSWKYKWKHTVQSQSDIR